MLFDVVPCHTSIEHPWFREHPELVRLVGPRRPAEQLARDVRRPGVVARPARPAAGTCTRSIPSSPTSTGATPRCAEAFGDGAALLAGRAASTASASTRWTASSRTRELRDDPPAHGAAAAARGTPTYAALEHAPLAQRARHRRRRWRALRDARPATRCLVGEVYLPTAGLAPYLEHLDACVLLRAVPRAVGGRRGRAPRVAARRRRRAGRPGCSPTTTSRACPTASGAAQRPRRGAAAADAPGDGVRLPGRRDRAWPTARAGRRPRRRPRRPRRVTAPDASGTPRRTAASRTGEPWLRAVDPPRATSPARRADPGSLLHLYRDADRAAPRAGRRVRAARRRATASLAFRRGAHLVALNLGDSAPAAAGGAPVVLRTHAPIRVDAPLPARRSGRSRAAGGLSQTPRGVGIDATGMRACAGRVGHRGGLRRRSAGVLAACGGGSSSGTRDAQLSGSSTSRRARSRPRPSAAPTQSNGRYKITFNALVQRRRRAAPVARPPPRGEGLVASTSLAWTSSGPPSSPRPAGSSRGPRTYAARSAGHAAGPARRPRPTRASSTRRRRTRNTQLLWYRKDLVKHAAQDVGRADRPGREAAQGGRIEIQGAQYEGVTVWFNSLVQSAGGTIVDGHDKVDARPAGPSRPPTIMQQARDLAGRRPVARQPEGGPEPPRLRGRATPRSRSTTRSSIRARRPTTRRSSSTSPGRRIRRSTPASPRKAPIGGINWGVGAYTKHPARGLRGRRLPAQRGEPADGGDQGRPAADARDALRRPGVHQGRIRSPT